MASPEHRGRAALEDQWLREQLEQLTRAGTWRWCPENNELDWSDNLFRLYGLEPRQIAPSWQWVLERTHPEDRSRLRADSELVAAPDRGLLASAAPGNSFEYRFMPLGFGVRRLRWAVAAVERAPGEPDQVWGVVQDVSDYALAEHQAQLQALALRALLGGGSLEVTIERLLRDLGRQLGCELGVMWVRRGEELVARVIWEHSTLGPELGPAISRLRLSVGSGLAGRAWESEGPVTVDSLAHDDRYEPHQIAVRAGIRAAVAVPVRVDGEVLAVLSLGARSPIALAGVDEGTFELIGGDVGAFLTRRRGQLAPSTLTPRELEILTLAAQGHAVHRLAAMLGISPSTVKTHLEQVYRKLGVSDRTAAVAEMMRRGVIE